MQTEKHKNQRYNFGRKIETEASASSRALFRLPAALASESVSYNYSCSISMSLFWTDMKQIIKG